MTLERPETVQSLSLSADGLAVPAREVRRLGRCGPQARWQPQIQAAIDELRTLARPQARWRWLRPVQLTGCFADPAPVQDICAGRPCCAFVATISQPTVARIQAHMSHRRFLESVLLDAAASAMVESLCDAVERHCVPDGQSTRFSPGYCGWTLRGQTQLFELLEPAAMGVQLRESLLMDPLKTVSGVIVCGDPEALRVPADACESCHAQACKRRAPRRGSTG